MKNNNKREERMTILKSIITTTALSSCLLMTACHNNPLEKHSNLDNARAFKAAAQKAERQLNIKMLTKGLSYRLCMEGRQSDINCKALFQEMLTDLKHEPGYEQITQAELSGAATWIALKEEYKHLLFIALD